VLHELFGKFVRVTVDLVNVDSVVMGSNSEVLSVWRVSHALTPFFWVFEGGNLFV
jgi:hypothetical protein